MKNTNINLINKQFSEIKPRLEYADKLDAAKKLRCSPITVERYLRGQVAKEAFALDMLKFFKDRIAERDAKAEQILND